MDIQIKNGTWQRVGENGNSSDPSLKLPFKRDIRTAIVPDPGNTRPGYKIRMQYEIAFQDYHKSIDTIMTIPNATWSYGMHIPLCWLLEQYRDTLKDTLAEFP